MNPDETLFEGIIFDMDGVLWDSGPCHESAFRRVLSEAGVSDFDYAAVAGQRTIDVIEVLVGKAGRPAAAAEIERLAAAKSAYALQQLQATNPVFSGVLDALERIAARFPVALATSGSRQSMDTFLERNGCRNFFRATLHGGDVAKAKPAPDLYLLACGKLGLEPSRCLVVEDSPSGIIAAKRAGCNVVALPTTAPVEELLSAGAGEVLPSLTALIGRLGLAGLSVLTKYEAAALHLPASSPEEWTAIVPAAGRGTRLASELPKVLFPVAGRPILDWLLDLLLPIASRIVVVASPGGAEPIQSHLSRRGGDAVAVAIQPEPLGMADAIQHGLADVNTPRTLIVWGDQVALRRETIDCAMRAHTRLGPLATVPTLIRRQPYIHLERAQKKGCIQRVAQAREGDPMPESGESDAGLFLVQTAALGRYLTLAHGAPECRGSNTGEVNFLPLLGLMDGTPGNVLGLRIVDEEEAVGVNSRADADALAEVLMRRRVAVS